jgi:membrane-associated protease RseP (regulator of RpoE activity)
MIFALGVVLFGLGIGVSVMLHEAGHMVTAKQFGMKVTQYFVGFGPTLWSFRRGETEYGIKPIPAGGFCRIEGMTPLEDEQLRPAESHRAFWRQKLWKRTIVLSAGSLTHFLLGIILLFVAAAWVGLPNPAYAAALDHPNSQPAVIGTVAHCVQPYNPADPSGSGPCTSSDPASPARQAGLHAGDRITAIGGEPVHDWGDLVAATHDAGGGLTTIGYVRDGRQHSATVDLVVVRRAVGGTVQHPKIAKAATIGITLRQPQIPQMIAYGPLHAFGPTGSYTAQLFTGTFAAIGQFPERIPNLLNAISGGHRDQNTPISVVGASRLGGQVLAHGGASGPTLFLAFLASLNMFIGIFNLFPLLPLDGGHIAIAWFERLRTWAATRLGKPDPGRVDYTKLLPVTYFVILVFGGISVLTIAADIVNPVQLFSK